jgi:hypothetical protein
VELQANNDINVNAAVSMQSAPEARDQQRQRQCGHCHVGGGNLRLADTEPPARVWWTSFGTINGRIAGDLGRDSPAGHITGNVTFATVPGLWQVEASTADFQSPAAKP